MYQLFGARLLAGWFASIAGFAGVAVMVARAFLGHSPPDYAVGLAWWVWTGFGTGATLATVLMFSIGRSPAFPLLCRHTPLGRVFPPIEGIWQGTLLSNWTQIAARLGQAAPVSTVPTEATIRVKARLLEVAMTLDTKDRYSNSKSLLVGVGRPFGEDGITLTYVYENSTDRPRTGDSGHHFGAARLRLETNAGEMMLRGPYWTNRNWSEAKNTAGLANFTKTKLRQ